jgi:hypothetical protein
MTTPSSTLTIDITPTEPNDMGRLADATLTFGDGPAAGCQLVGFAVWRNKRGVGVNVTFPGRAYTNARGEKRTYSFIQGSRESLASLRALIIEAYERVARAAVDKPSV